MKVLIVYAHPNPRSFNHAILEAFTKGLSDAGHNYEVIDLYAVKFNPCLSQDDVDLFTNEKIPDDIKRQQEKVSQTDGLAFIYPIWWTGPPAMLKGWIDRVFFMGFAYDFDEKTGQYTGLLKHQKGLFINTAGASEEAAEMVGLEVALKKINNEGILQFCGIKEVLQTIFHNVVMADDATLKGYLEDTYQLGRNF